jgi:hypothetical protein
MKFTKTYCITVDSALLIDNEDRLYSWKSKKKADAVAVYLRKDTGGSRNINVVETITAKRI